MVTFAKARASLVQVSYGLDDSPGAGGRSETLEHRRRDQQVGSTRAAESWASRPNWCHLHFHGHRRLRPDEVARYLFRRVVSWGRSSNVFLRNGARLYLDAGSHPEYATAECDNLIPARHPRPGG